MTEVADSLKAVDLWEHPTQRTFMHPYWDVALSTGAPSEATYLMAKDLCWELRCQR